jgi:hypothetical protein
MPIFERPPIETLALAKDRWTPIYLEHGRLEVDDASVKWIGANGLLCRLPVATISSIMLGPGTNPSNWDMADDINRALSTANASLYALYTAVVCSLGYIKRNAEGLGMLIISSDNNCQGFKIDTYGETNRRDTEISGLWLVAEKWVNPENCPF